MAQSIDNYAAIVLTLAASSGNATAITLPVGCKAVRMESSGAATIFYSPGGTDGGAMGNNRATIPNGSAEWVELDPRTHGSPRPVLYVGASMNNGTVVFLPSRTRQ